MARRLAYQLFQQNLKKNQRPKPSLVDGNFAAGAEEDKTAKVKEQIEAAASNGRNAAVGKRQDTTEETRQLDPQTDHED